MSQPPSKWGKGGARHTEMCNLGPHMATTIDRMPPATAWLNLPHTFSILPVSHLIQSLSGVVLLLQHT